MSNDCIFCKLVAGEVPSTKVYEDEYVYAFDDIEPEAPVHVLVVPKTHYHELNDEVPAEALGHIMAAIPKVAKIKGVDESGFRCIINVGPDSAQTVPHMHVHVIGGAKMGRSTFEGSWARIGSRTQSNAFRWGTWPLGSRAPLHALASALSCAKHASMVVATPVRLGAAHAYAGAPCAIGHHIAHVQSLYSKRNGTRI